MNYHMNKLDDTLLDCLICLKLLKRPLKKEKRLSFCDKVRLESHVPIQDHTRERDMYGFLVIGMGLRSSPLKKDLTKEWDGCGLPGDDMEDWKPPTKEWSNYSAKGT